MLLKTFYIHLEMFLFDDVFPDFEYIELHHQPGFLNMKMRHILPAMQKNQDITFAP